MGLTVGIVGGTGAVGTKMIEILKEKNLNITKLRLFASERTVGQKVLFNNEEVTVELLTKEVMKEKFDYLLLAAGGTISAEFAPIAADAGNIVIDNSSHWRMTEGIPLVIPEVNGNILRGYRGIISNPNCSTTQMVMVLAPLHRRYGIKREIGRASCRERV